MPGIKEVKHFTKTASSDSKSEDLHNDSIYIINTQHTSTYIDIDTRDIHRFNIQNLRFTQKKNGNPSTKSNTLNYLGTKFNALEPKIPYSSKAVSAELYEKFNSNIRTTFKNHFTKKLKQIYLYEVIGNSQYSFSMDQLEKLEEVHPNSMSKYNTDIKDKC